MSNCSELAEKLLTLGKLKDKAPDYKELGFSVANADELIRMATHPKLLNNDDKSPLFWATVHAWYALGHLQITDATKNNPVVVMPICAQSCLYELPRLYPAIFLVDLG